MTERTKTELKDVDCRSKTGSVDLSLDTVVRLEGDFPRDGQEKTAFLFLKRCLKRCSRVQSVHVSSMEF